MNRFTAVRTFNRYTQTIKAAPERIFPLLCPVREAEWVEGWAGRPVFATTGLAEENGVYATDHAGEKEPTIWFITRRDPIAFETEFVFFVPGQQVVRLSIGIKQRAPDESNVLISYLRTGLSEAGNARVAESGRADVFEQRMIEWENAINHYLTTGQQLRAA